ncbi:MAG: SIS domain-containing protein [Planctomycetota bacterium]
MSDKADEVRSSLDRSAAALAELCGQAAAVAEIIEKVADSLRKGGSLFLCGNGGSAAQCQHVAAELTGRFKLERRGLRAVSLTTDTSALTAIGNDYGFDQVFARQLEALARPGDVLIGLSTSGSSKNVVRAFEKARQMGVATIALVGPKGGELADLADACLAAPGEATAVVQECHIAALHAMCEIVERDLPG